MKIHFKFTARVLAFLLMLAISLPLTAYAADNEQRRVLGNDALTNTGKDNGYSGNNVIDIQDPHYGWRMGQFFVTGYTRASKDAEQNPVFLKNLGDTVTLWFNLERDIEDLKGDSELTISEDTNGYFEAMQIPKTNFEHGALIIRHTDWQNNPGDPIIHCDYLRSMAELNTDKEVELFEEGDYEIVLLYEIRKDNFPLPDSYTNYRVSFKFSVRNGNCMVFPFDVKTGDELNNSSLTENGFSLDLAKSRYLNINVRREILVEGTDEFTTDTRFNRPAKDGDQYTEEGIYTITVINLYTDVEDTKKIYVGKDNILKAYVTTDLPLNEIKAQLLAGAQINDDGTIFYPASSAEITVTAANTYTPLAGAVFAIKDENGVQISNEYTTGNDGKAIIPSLERGDYSVTMIKAPDNYILNEREQTINVTSDKAATVAFTVIEFPSLNICAVDPENGEYVAGVKFNIADADNAIIEELETLSTGVVLTKPVRPGSYTITGTHNANGDVMNETTKFAIEVREDGMVYYDNIVLTDNTLMFQAKGALTSEETDAATTDEGASVFVKTEADEKADFPVAIVIVVIVVVLAAAAIFVIRRHSMKSPIDSDIEVPMNIDVGGDD